MEISLSLGCEINNGKNIIAMVDVFDDWIIFYICSKEKKDNH